MFEKEEKKELKEKESVLVTVKPLKDFEFMHNEFKYSLKKGKKQEVHRKFLEILKTAKIIN